MGKYPVEAVAILAGIAEAIETCRPSHSVRESLKAIDPRDQVSLTDLISLSVEMTLEHIAPAAVFVPTHGGATARHITRFRLPVWIVAASSQEATCQRLQFSYGVHPVYEPGHPDDWNANVREWLRGHEVEGNLVVLTEGPSSKRPDTNHQIIDLGSPV